MVIVLEPRGADYKEGRAAALSKAGRGWGGMLVGRVGEGGVERREENVKSGEVRQRKRVALAIRERLTYLRCVNDK